MSGLASPLTSATTSDEGESPTGPTLSTCASRNVGIRVDRYLTAWFGFEPPHAARMKPAATDTSAKRTNLEPSKAQDLDKTRSCLAWRRDGCTSRTPVLAHF